MATTLSLTAADTPLVPRFSAAYMDTTVDPRVDFAHYAWGGWSKDNPVPADKASWGSFNELDQYNQNALKGILERVAVTQHEPGSIEQKVGDFFASAMDTAAIDAAGLAPIADDLAMIAAIASPADLARAVAALHNQQITVLFNVGVGPDEKNSTMNALQSGQGGLSLPSRDYYFAPQFEKIRTAFVEHVAKMFTLAGDNSETAATGAKLVFATEQALAEQASTPVQLRDPIANYNKMATTEFIALVPALPLADYLADRGVTGPAAGEIIVGQPKFFAGLQTALVARPLNDWKTYMRYRVLRATAGSLAAPLEAERFHFYGTVLRGTPAMEPRWQRSARIVDGEIGEALGQLYVAQYYPPEAKARMDEMIANITAAMRERLAQLTWMSPETKAKALAKFERFYPKVGHPEKWRDYAKLNVIRGNFMANIRAANEFEDRRNIAKLGLPVDKTEWFMSPPTVNAYFDPTANNINFPAGILQPPFFDFTLDDAVNYGAIGAVIGHEITHGFDDQGRQYDGDGNLRDWWTEADAQEFKVRAQKMIDQYNGYEVLPDVHVNGELTLGENIADLGGITLAYDALQRSLRGKERKKIDGLTEEQRFFISWAQVWRTNIRENALRQLVATNPHAPGQIRAFGPLVNFQPFYDAFGIKEGDPMWLPPERRTKIW